MSHLAKSESFCSLKPELLAENITPNMVQTQRAVRPVKQQRKTNKSEDHNAGRAACEVLRRPQDEEAV
jgi:hypothetical protein